MAPLTSKPDSHREPASFSQKCRLVEFIRNNFHGFAFGGNIYVPKLRSSHPSNKPQEDILALQDRMYNLDVLAFDVVATKFKNCTKADVLEDGFIDVIADHFNAARADISRSREDSHSREHLLGLRPSPRPALKRKDTGDTGHGSESSKRQMTAAAHQAAVYQLMDPAQQTAPAQQTTSAQQTVNAPQTTNAQQTIPARQTTSVQTTPVQQTASARSTPVYSSYMFYLGLHQLQERHQQEHKQHHQNHLNKPELLARILVAYPDMFLQAATAAAPSRGSAPQLAHGDDPSECLLMFDKVLRQMKERHAEALKQHYRNYLDRPELRELVLATYPDLRVDAEVEGRQD